jgi:hypothetical protein
VINPSQRPLPDNTQHSQDTSMPPAGFEPAIPARERPQTHASDRAATGFGTGRVLLQVKCDQHDQVSQFAGICFVLCFYKPALHSFVLYTCSLSPYVILCSSYTHLFSTFLAILRLFLRLLSGWGTCCCCRKFKFVTTVHTHTHSHKTQNPLL